VIALPTDAALTPAERFALDLLVDLSAVLPFDGAGDVVRLHVAGEPRDLTAAELRARDWGLARADGSVNVDRALLRFVADVAGFKGYFANYGAFPRVCARLFCALT
jgi:hypothetical protein